MYKRLSLLVAACAALALTAVPRLHVQATVRVGGQPTWLAVGAGSLWAANYGSANVERIDPKRNRVVARINPHMDPYGIAYGAGSVWVSSFDDTVVVRIDPKTNLVTARIDVGGSEQAGIHAYADSVWVALYGEGEVVRIDAAKASVAARIPVGGNPEDAVVYAGAVWVPNENGTLARIDPQRNTVLATIHVGSDPDNVIGCAGKVWTTNLNGPMLLAVDPAQNRVVETLKIGAGNVGLACGRSLWTAAYGTGFAYRLNPRSRNVTGRVAVGVQPRALAVMSGSVWVANQRSGTITRIRGR